MDWQAIAGNLQDSMTKKYAQYEGELASLRAQAVEEIKELKQRISELEHELATERANRDTPPGDSDDLSNGDSSADGKVLLFPERQDEV